MIKLQDMVKLPGNDELIAENLMRAIDLQNEIFALVGLLGASRVFNYGIEMHCQQLQDYCDAIDGENNDA